MPHTLLLADDSLTMQRVIELTFADEDVDVISVSDGDEAIDLLETAPPDIVLADVGIAGRDGYEVARYIRQSPRLAHIPVVLLTGAFEPVDQAKAAEVGCDGVLAKPFEPQLVIGRVRELLGSARTPPPERETPRAPVVEREVQAPLLGDYFERLDSAFARRSARSSEAAPDRAAPREPAGTAPSPVDPLELSPPADSGPAPPDASEAALPLSFASPRTAFGPSVDSGSAPAAADHGAEARAAPRRLPSVAEAFAAILAAEQQEGPAPRAPWPAAAPAAYGDIPEEAIERIAQRVIARLSDRAVRGTVAALAERLIREEIARIKASIK